jgi:hypothetical protein
MYRKQSDWGFILWDFEVMFQPPNAFHAHLEFIQNRIGTLSLVRIRFQFNRD